MNDTVTNSAPPTSSSAVSQSSRFNDLLGNGGLNGLPPMLALSFLGFAFSEQGEKSLSVSNERLNNIRDNLDRLNSAAAFTVTGDVTDINDLIELRDVYGEFVDADTYAPADIDPNVAAANADAAIAALGGGGDVVHPKVDVAFNSENAGYSNAVYTYRLDENGEPTDIELVFADSNNIEDGAVGQFHTDENGQPLILVVANGANNSQLDGNPELSVNDSGQLTAGGSAVSSSVYFSHSDELSSGSYENFRTSEGDAGFTYEIEDLKNGGDKDHDDLVLSADGTDVTHTQLIKSIGDQDGEPGLSKEDLIYAQEEGLITIDEDGNIELTEFFSSFSVDTEAREGLLDSLQTASTSQSNELQRLITQAQSDANRIEQGNSFGESARQTGQTNTDVLLGRA